MVAGIKLTNDEVIKRFVEKHGERYDYSKTVYVNYDTPVTITCKSHGEFTISAYRHWQGKGHCPKCQDGKILKGDKAWFIERAIVVHGNKYSYDSVEYVRSSDKVTITCPLHGDFECSPTCHMAGVGCPHCAGKYFGFAGSIEKANRLFSEKVSKLNQDYDVISNYEGKLKPVLVRHKLCGREFEVFAGTLASRKISCKHCEKMYFDSEAVTILYYLQISTAVETYYKIGLTQQSNVHKRYSTRATLPNGYSYKVIYTALGNGKESREKEQEILKTFKQYKATPKEKFGGYTECFNTDISKLPGFFEIFNHP